MTKGEKKDEKLRVEEKYKALVETAPDAVFTFDLLGRFTFVNPAGERISGYSEEELLGKHFREFLPANYIPACLNMFQKSLRGQPTPPLEIEMITKQGDRVPLELLGRPVKRGKRVVEIIGIARGITERKRAEEALRESEERYRSVVENSHAGIIILDDAYRLIYVNDELCRISGYSREEIIGQDFQSFLDDESKQLVADRYVRRQRGEKVPPRYEFNIVRKDGEKRRIEISSTVTKDSAGRVKTVAQILDITERRQAEEALRESEEKYRTILESIEDGYYEVDLAGNLTFFNDALSRIFGYPQDELMGMNNRQYMDDETAKAVYQAFNDVYRTGKPASIFDHGIITKDGTKRSIQASISLIRGSTGEPAGFRGIIRDITERKRVEEALRESEARYLDLFENASDLVQIIAPDGRLLYVNRAWRETLGYSQEDIASLSLPDTIHPDSQAHCMEVFQRVMSGEKADGVEASFVTKDGKRIAVEASASCKLVDGKPVQIRGIFRDITERKRAEEEIRRRSEELAALYDVSLDVAAQLDLDTLLKTILLRAMELLRANAGGLYLYHPERQDLELVVTQGLRKDYTGIRLALGEGACGKVAQSGDPLVVTDYAKWDGRSPHFDDEPTFSVLAVPIKRGDTLLGALYVDDPDVERRFDDGDIRLATLFANQAAIAIENAQLFQESQRRAEEMAALRQVSLATLSTLERNQVFETMLDQLGTVIEYDTAAIKIITPDGRDKMIAGRGPVIYDQAMWNGFDAKDSKLVQEMKETRQTVVVHDAHADERYERVGDWEAFRSWVGAPLFVKDDLIGYLAVEKTSPGFYDENAVQLLSDFARAAAIALENARLFADTKSQLAQLTALQETTGAVASTLELDKLLNLITQQATTLLQANGGIINLVDWEKNEDEVVAGSGSAASTLGYRSPLEGSLSGWATLHNQPVISNQLQNDSRADRRPRAWLVDGMKQQTQSVAIAPLTIKEQVIGTLVVMDKQGGKGEFNQADLDLLVAFANQAATAIENARLYEETEKRLAETTVLHKVAEIINATLDLKEVFQRVVEELSRAFGYRLVDIYLLEEEGLRLQAQVGYDRKTTIDFTVLERGVVGRVAQTGQPAFVPDVSQDPDYIPNYPEIKSEICVPVKSGQTLLGTLNVESDAKRPLTDDDLKLLVTLSSHIGVAIENAHLYEAEQRRSAQRRTIAEVGRRTASILEMDALLPQVVDLIAQNFGYYHVHIFQIDPDSDYAVHKAGTGKPGLAIAEEGLRLKVGEEGIIGWVAQHGQPLLVNDVDQEPRYYPHPALPDTRSELAVPIHVGGRILGVLDVQSMELDAFDEGDLETLQTLASQLAVAMENARLYQATEQLAITDGLTGLYNLRYFYEALEKEIQRSERYHRPVSLIILDIDNFKRYNDTHGHLAGDYLLKELAQLMSGVIRQTDTLARYGGEEFAIILPETETAGARFLAERLLGEVREYRFSMQDGQAIGRITISLGVATHPHHADSAKALVDAADKALLRAKRAGKNRLSVHGEELIELKPR